MLADEIGPPFNRVYALAFLATGHCERGESAETLRFAGRARRLAEEQGFDLWAGIAGVWEATERVVTGDRAALDDVLAGRIRRRRDGTCSEAAPTCSAGWPRRPAPPATAKMTAGPPRTALTLSADTGQPWWDSALHRQLAELHVDAAAARGRTGPGRSRPSVVAGGRSPGSTRSGRPSGWGCPVHGVRAAAGYAGLLQRTGERDEGRRLLADWYGRCTEGLATPVLAAVRSQLEALGGGSA